MANINVIGSIASIVGAVIGLPALVIAFNQLRRTKKSADAAANAAEQTLARLSRVTALATLEQICSRSSDLLHLFREKKLKEAATAAFELRQSITKFSSSKIASVLMNVEGWSNLLNKIIVTHEALEKTASIRRIDSEEHVDRLNAIATIHDDLSKLAARSGEKVGESHVDSQ